MKGPLILYLAVSSLLHILNVNAQRCANDVDYAYGTVTQACNWIRHDENRRQELCMNTAVALNCPISCGHCCDNDLKYSFNVNAGSSERCSWLANNQDKKDKWCGKFLNGQLIQDGCPKECGICLQKVTTISRTLYLNGHQTSESTTISPEDEQDTDCGNTDTYMYNNTVAQNCMWIHRLESRRKLLC